MNLVTKSVSRSRKYCFDARFVTKLKRRAWRKYRRNTRMLIQANEAEFLDDVDFYPRRYLTSWEVI